MTSEDSSSYRERVLQHWDLLEHLAEDRFGKPDPNLSNEALLYVEEALAENGWKRIRAYRGESGFATLLSYVVKRLLEDFARSRFGRFRCPEWIRRHGTLWEDVYRLLCAERMAVADVIGMLSASAPVCTISYRY